RVDDTCREARAFSENQEGAAATVPAEGPAKEIDETVSIDVAGRSYLRPWKTFDAKAVRVVRGRQVELWNETRRVPVDDVDAPATNKKIGNTVAVDIPGRG